MFLLRTEDSVMEKVNFISTHTIPQKLDAYIKKFYALPTHISVQVEMREFSIFPDIFLKPYPLVSEMIMDVMRMYRIEPLFKRVILQDRTKGEYKVYFLLCIDEDTVSLYRDFELKRSQKDELTCIISLDFAESILRRDAQGIELVECSRQED